jgi:hypothetical protein
VLILPSKIPLDLRLHFRDLDEERLVRRMGASPLELSQLTLWLSERNVPTGPHELVGAIGGAVRCGSTYSFSYPAD